MFSIFVFLNFELASFYSSQQLFTCQLRHELNFFFDLRPDDKEHDDVNYDTEKNKDDRIIDAAVI